MNIVEFNKFYEEVISKDISEESKNFIQEWHNAINAPEKKKPMTETGSSIIRFMQNKPINTYTAKQIADGIGISSRSVSGAMRKLYDEGYVKKAGSNPIIYALDELGINYQN